MGLKKNFVFSTILTASNYIFPFIVYPYVSRVLGVNNVGIVNFVHGLVTYATLISMMGITIVGVREVAKSKHDRRELDATFTSLVTICATFTLMATIALMVATYTIDDLREYRPLLLIGVVRLWSNFLLIDWLYNGLEDFKYITIRTILVKIAYLVSVFVFIHRPDDYITYYLLMCLMVTVNAMFNCARAAKLVRLRLAWRPTLMLIRPVVMLGIYMLLNSMYTTFNTIYLGFTHSDTEVGYYSTATKIFSIILAIYTAYSNVVMPRVSALLSEGRTDEFRRLIGKSIQALILIAVPAVTFAMLYSPGIVRLIAGNGYDGAILPMTIVMPLIFIIGYEQILVVQTLTPLASDRIILLNSIVGASVGVLGNLLLVGRLAAVGSAIVWVAAEVVVLLLSQYFVTRKVGLRFPARDLAVNIAAYMPYVAIAWAMVSYAPFDAIAQMLAGAVIMAVYTLIVQRYVLHNEIFMTYMARLTSRLNRRHL